MENPKNNWISCKTLLNICWKIEAKMIIANFNLTLFTIVKSNIESLTVITHKMHYLCILFYAFSIYQESTKLTLNVLNWGSRAANECYHSLPR